MCKLRIVKCLPTVLQLRELQLDFMRETPCTCFVSPGATISCFAPTLSPLRLFVCFYSLFFALLIEAAKEANYYYYSYSNSIYLIQTCFSKKNKKSHTKPHFSLSLSNNLAKPHKKEISLELHMKVRNSKRY